jgi:PIN domain nuclease of toxin-antitoxin system
MEREIASNAFSILHIEPRHAAAVSKLPLHHRDPFDRLIVAQALVEGIPIVSSDVQLDAYGVARLW